MVEQFKNTLPNSIVTYINEQKVNKISESGQLADEFVLMHKVCVGDHGGRDVACRKSSKHLSEGMGKFPVREDCSAHAKSDPNRACNYCLGKGH